MEGNCWLLVNVERIERRFTVAILLNFVIVCLTELDERQSNMGMTVNTDEKWVAFLMSLAVPGAGQLLARSYSSLFWIGLAAVAVAGSAAGNQRSIEFGNPVGTALWILVAFSSAEHAKRLFEPRRSLTGNCTTRQSCTLASRGSFIRMRFELNVPTELDDVWDEISNLSDFTCIDPFHTRVKVMSRQLTKGADLALEHSAFGCRFFRFGRLLRFQSHCGYTFSDISRHGCRVGFPHVFMIDVESSDVASTILSVEVRGRWTARWVPVTLGKLWLKFVCREHERLLRTAL
jgi:hypothetical protein